MFGGVHLKFGSATEFIWTKRRSLIEICTAASEFFYECCNLGEERILSERISNVASTFVKEEKTFCLQTGLLQFIPRYLKKVHKVDQT